MSIYNNKNVLVTGGTGMIGRQLVALLHEAGARVRVVSMDNGEGLPEGVTFQKLNLMLYENCMKACVGMDYVFHLAGIKVSAGISQTRPASHFVPNVLFNTNMLEAARSSGVARYLYTSSIGVYAPAERFLEDTVWKTFPSPNDWYGGWAKRIGELQVGAYQVEYGWKEIAIVRPANVYGPYDNFDPANAMVIPALIRRALDGENPLTVWGDGSEIRDFIYASDVAAGMLVALEHADGVPINLGSGSGFSIKELAETICACLPHPPKIAWDTTKKAGDKIRIMDIARARSLGWEPKVDLKTGIEKTIEWFLANRDRIDKKYNVFHQKKFIA